MKRQQPAPAPSLLQRQPRICQPTLIKEITRAVRQRAPRHRWNCVNNDAKFIFVLPDPFFRLPRSGDVHDGPDKLDAAPFIA